jgi:phosphate:Na+ symporter
MAILNIASGVALILFGIRFLRKGLERLFGRAFYDWLERRAGKPWSAAIAGLLFGTVAPSSTAQTLIALQMMRAGKLSVDSVLGFLLGANLGITVTIQLIAFRIFAYYSVFIVAGLAGFLWSTREDVRGAGQTCLGLGFVFLAMDLTTQAARVLTANPDFMTVLGVLVHYRVLVLLFAAVLTLAMQSSTAVIGLALAIGATGAASHELILPVILGTNLGIGLSSLLAGLATPEGRRLAAANLLLKGAAILLVLVAFPQVESWVAASPGTLVRQSADFHSAFNLFVTVIGVILAIPIGKLMERVVRPVRVQVDGAVPSTHLDPAALQTPVFALANATRETLRSADAVKSMLQNAWRAFVTQDVQLAAQVQKQDDRIDELNSNIKAYLSQLPPETLTPDDLQLQFGLLNFSSQLESIADVVDKSLCGGVIAHAPEKIRIVPEDQAELDELEQKVLHRFDTAISLLATRDRALAERFLKESDELKEWCIAVQKRHYARLVAGNPQAMASSTRYLDVFNVLRRISGQLNTIGHTFVLS